MSPTPALDRSDARSPLLDGQQASEGKDDRDSVAVGVQASPPPPRKQSLFGADEDAHREEFLQVARMDGYQASWWRSARYWLACLLSAGVIWLVNLWFFDAVVPWRYKRVPLSEATLVLVVGKVHGAELLPVRQLGDDVPPEMLQDSPQCALLAHDLTRAAGGINASRRGESTDVLAHPGGPRGRFIQWRHMRWIYYPAVDAFLMQQSDVVSKRAQAAAATSMSQSDQRHTSVAALKAKEIHQRMRSGLTQDQCMDNTILYGINALILEVPSIPTLLYQEVFHPFYVFQSVPMRIGSTHARL